MPLGRRGAAAASLAATGAACLLAGGALEVGIVLGVYAATLANLLMTRALAGEALARAPGPRAGGRKDVDKTRIVLYALGKAAVLVGALTVGGLHMKERVVIPLANHVAQIFILGAGPLGRRA